MLIVNNLVDETSEGKDIHGLKRVDLIRVHFREVLILINKVLMINELLRSERSTLIRSDVRVGKEQLISTVILIMNVKRFIERQVSQDC